MELSGVLRDGTLITEWGCSLLHSCIESGRLRSSPVIHHHHHYHLSINIYLYCTVYLFASFVYLLSCASQYTQTKLLISQ